MKQIIILLAVIYTASAALSAGATTLQTCYKAAGYETYGDFLLKVALTNGNLKEPMGPCLKEQLGASKTQADADFKALKFKPAKFRAFLVGNTELYGADANLKANGATDNSGFANYALCDLGTSEDLTFDQVNHILTGLIYEFLSCD